VQACRPRGFPPVAGRGDDRGEAELAALLEPAVACVAGRRRPVRPSSPKAASPVATGSRTRRRGDRERDPEVGSRLVDAHAARDVDEHVGAAERQAGVAPRTATIIASRRWSTPVATRRGIAGRWARRATGSRAAADACPAGRRRPWRRPRPLAQPEDRRGVGHADEPGAGHLEDGELVRSSRSGSWSRADAVSEVAIALELEHAVDEVLEHARTCERTVLRHVTDEERGDPDLLRDPQDATRRLAHLRDRTRRGTDTGRMERLHRVDHADVGAFALERRADDIEVGLGKDLDLSPQPRQPGARSLTCSTDSSPVTSSARRVRETAPSTESSSVDLPTPGSPPTRTSEARDESSAEHTVELVDTRRDTVGLLSATSTSRRTGRPAQQAAGAARAPRRACRRRRSRDSGRASAPRSFRTRCRRAGGLPTWPSGVHCTQPVRRRRGAPHASVE
jgi:hypothetical protein